MIPNCLQFQEFIKLGEDWLLRKIGKTQNERVGLCLVRNLKTQLKHLIKMFLIHILAITLIPRLVQTIITCNVKEIEKREIYNILY